MAEAALACLATWLIGFYLIEHDRGKPGLGCTRLLVLLTGIVVGVVTLFAGCHSL